MRKKKRYIGTCRNYCLSEAASSCTLQLLRNFSVFTWIDWRYMYLKLLRLYLTCTKDEPVQNDAPIYLKYYYLYDYRGKMQSSTHNPDAMFSAPVFESLSELLIPRRYVILCVGLMLMFFFWRFFFSPWDLAVVFCSTFFYVHSCILFFETNCAWYL
jgi:hypothetical protein